MASFHKPETPLVLEGDDAQRFLDASFVCLWPTVVTRVAPNHSFAVGVKWLPPEDISDFDPHIVWRHDFNPDGSVARLRVGIGKIVRHKEVILGAAVDVIVPSQCGLSARAAMAVCMDERLCYFRSLATRRIAFFTIAFSSSQSRIRRCKSRTSWSPGRRVPLPTNGRSGCCRPWVTPWCNVVSGMPQSRATSAIGFVRSVTHGTACALNAASYCVAIVCTSMGIRVSSPSSRCPWNRLTSKGNFRLVRIPTPKSVRKFYVATKQWMQAHRHAPPAL